MPSTPVRGGRVLFLCERVALLRIMTLSYNYPEKKKKKASRAKKIVLRCSQDGARGEARVRPTQSLRERQLWAGIELGRSFANPEDWRDSPETEGLERAYRSNCEGLSHTVQKPR